MPTHKSRFRFQVSDFRSTNVFASPFNLKLETLNLKRRKSRGLSLVELIMFIVIVSAAVAGIISVIDITTRSSADPMTRKQALAIAEAVLEEVQLQPFTYCDPDDPAAATADLAGGAISIGTIASASGPSGGGNSTLDVTGVNLTGRNAVVVFVGYNNDGNETVTSAVIDPGGASQTSMGAALATANTVDDARIYIFGLVNPPQGVFTIQVTFSAALQSSRGSNIVAYPLSGVDTAAAFGAPGTNASSSGNGSVVVPSASLELVLAGVAGETIGTSTVAPLAVEDVDISGGSGSTTHHLATARQNGGSPNVSFFWTHTDDHWAAAGVSVKPGGGCPTLAEAIGPEPGETRYSTVTPFDNVNDYHGFDSNTATPSGIRNIDGTLIAGLEGYRVTVSVAGQPLGGIGNDAGGNAQSLLITVTVTGPGNTTVTLNGYRTRYAPNDLP
jgi:Tfp pilus assembly protein PilV